MLSCRGVQSLADMGKCLCHAIGQAPKTSIDAKAVLPRRLHMLLYIYDVHLVVAHAN